MSGTLAWLGVTWMAAALTAVQPAEQPGAAQPGQGGVPAGHPQIPMPTAGAEWPKARPEDVLSIDAIVKAFYEAPAGEPGEARDWNRWRSLFIPDARLVAARPGAEGSAGTFYLTVADYIEANKKYFEKGGFRDTEVGRRVEAFGNIAHVWSTYESRHKGDDAQPYTRGINSLQLLKDGERYWIVNVFWDYERPENPVPGKYLQTPKE